MRKNKFTSSYLAQKLNQKLSRVLIVLPLVCLAPASEAAVSINIGINVPTYPNLVLMPGYPVYYDPQITSNYFFYDGLYWVFQDDNWYASSWYNGPWDLVYPEDVPVYILRVPIRYYRQPPIYFRTWYAYEPPHWGEHWGRDWEDRHRGWDHWDHRAALRPAPLPVYQRQYSGNHYPVAEQQQYAIQSQHYHYKPREEITQQHFQQQEVRNSPNKNQQNQDHTIQVQRQDNTQTKDVGRHPNTINQSVNPNNDRNQVQIPTTSKQQQTVTETPRRDVNVDRQTLEKNDKRQDINRNSDSQRLQQKMDSLSKPSDNSRENSSRDRQDRQENHNNGNRHDDNDKHDQNR